MYGFWYGGGVRVSQFIDFASSRCGRSIKADLANLRCCRIATWKIKAFEVIAGRSAR
jgi:hypothetical protein